MWLLFQKAASHVDSVQSKAKASKAVSMLLSCGWWVRMSRYQCHGHNQNILSAPNRNLPDGLRVDG